jgi:hypothetical protein
MKKAEIAPGLLCRKRVDPEAIRSMDPLKGQTLKMR